VELLGSHDKLKWTRDNQGLEIRMPSANLEFAWVFRITPAGRKQHAWAAKETPKKAQRIDRAEFPG
jgi:Alpha-L-fucosidase C-terminal domain